MGSRKREIPRYTEWVHGAWPPIRSEEICLQLQELIKFNYKANLHSLPRIGCCTVLSLGAIL